MPAHHKKTFENISETKRNRILETATAEFAAKGYSSANINVIAEKAGISIGAMYKYFRSKEDLFLTVIDKGYQILEDVIRGIDLQNGSMYAKIEKILRAAQSYSRRYPELNLIYLDLASEGLVHLSQKLSRKMESISARFYQNLLVQGKADGTVDPDLDEKMASFCLDNLILMLQYSNTSEYFKERMRIFTGDDIFDNDEKTIQGIMRFIRGALSPPSCR
jgi:TetR/AcrR family transcriptional regulator